MPSAALIRCLVLKTLGLVDIPTENSKGNTHIQAYSDRNGMVQHKTEEHKTDNAESGALKEGQPEWGFNDKKMEFRGLSTWIMLEIQVYYR